MQNLNLDNRLPLPLTPPPAVQLGLEHGIFQGSRTVKDGYLFVLGRYNFAQERTDRNERETPDSFILNAGLGFSTRLLGQEAKLRLSANNLLDTAYFNHISRYRLINLPEQGRNIVLSLQVPVAL